ncbi:MAG: radical SAM protein [Nitrospinaceae bacterium]
MFSFKSLQRILPRLYSFLPFFLSPKSAFPPVHAFFEVTYRCNLRCQMCHYLEIIEDTESNRTYKNELSAAEVKKIIATLPRFALITFTGGEAIMKSDFMEILEFAASRQKVHIITNGTLLTESVVEKLMALRTKSIFGAGVFYLGVSIEGGQDLHDKITTVPGSFRKTKQGLERLIQKRNESGSRYPLVHLTCVINRSNVMDLVPLYDYANELGVNICNFVLDNPATYWHGKEYDQDNHLKNPTPPVEEIDPVVLKGQLDKLTDRSRSHATQLRFSPNYITPEEIVRYYSNKSSYRDYRCYIPWAKVAFSAYGDVFSCPHYRLGSFQEGEDPIAWKSERVREFRERLKDEKIFPGCLGCCQSEYIGSQERVEVLTRQELFKAPKKTFNRGAIAIK